MKKSMYVSMSTVLALSAITPVVSMAAENTAESENAKPGFYDVRTGKVVLLKDFMKLSSDQKKEVFRQTSNYFADGAGNAIKALEIALLTDEELDTNMQLETEVEEQFNVLLTANGKVLFLSEDEVSSALKQAIADAKKELDKLNAEQKKALEDAIKEAEDALSNSGATADDLQAALDKLDQAIESAITNSVSSALKEVIANAKAELDKVTGEQKKALEDAIKAAEDALRKAEVTSQELQNVLDKLKDALENATIEDPAVSAAKEAIEQARQTGKQEDIDRAQSLIDQLENGTVKNNLQSALDKIISGTVDLSGLSSLINKIQQLLATDSALYTPESVEALNLAVKKAEIVITQNEGKNATDETKQLIIRETAELQSALDSLVRKDELIFKPTSETQKNAPLFLDPVVTTPADLQKTSGGVLGLDIGILEAGLISASQISSINDSNRHHIEVADGTTLDLTASVAIHTVLGGHAFNIFVAKENNDGNFATIANYRGSSGGALGITRPTEIDLGTLDPGTYEIILGIEAGLSVIQVIPFKLIKQIQKDYTQASTEDSIVSGNVLAGQNHGEDGNLIVTSVQVEGTNKPSSIGINGIELDGKYGKLSIDRNGTYKYTPTSNPNNAGKKETFTFIMKDIEDGRSATGTLNISLEGITN